MGRLHSGFDIYLAPPEVPDAEVPLSFTAAVIVEDMYAKVLRVKTRNGANQWGVVYTLTGISRMQRNGTAVRWVGTNEQGETIQLTGMSTQGGCVPCSRR